MKGLVHIFCGDGKGKTTSAIGLGIRACGFGKHVMMIRFLKGNYSYELKILNKLKNFYILPCPKVINSTYSMTENQMQEASVLCTNMFLRAVSAVNNQECNVLILDEIFCAVNFQFLDNKLIIDLIKNKPHDLELVLTGQNPKPEVLELADYVSEIKKVEHPFETNVPARRGIEF